MCAETENKILAGWETSSQYWAKHQSLIAGMFSPLTAALIETAHIGPGQSVLDIGGGSGEPSLTIARMVGQSGLVTYTDPSAGMVQTAQAEADRRELTNIRFQQCAADRLPFPDNSFDVAVSRLAAMFFPDPVPCLAEILRVIKPCAYLSCVVWAGSVFNPFFSVVTESLARFIPVEPEDEDAPAAFRFARPGKLAKLLEEAGATSVSERTLDFRIQAPITRERFWDFRTEMSDTFRSKLAQLAENQAAAVKEAVLQAVSVYFENVDMSFPARVLIVSGQKHVDC